MLCSARILSETGPAKLIVIAPSPSLYLIAHPLHWLSSCCLHIHIMTEAEAVNFSNLSFMLESYSKLLILLRVVL